MYLIFWNQKNTHFIGALNLASDITASVSELEFSLGLHKFPAGDNLPVAGAAAVHVLQEPHARYVHH